MPDVAGPLDKPAHKHQHQSHQLHYLPPLAVTLPSSDSSNLHHHHHIHSQNQPSLQRQNLSHQHQLQHPLPLNNLQQGHQVPNEKNPNQPELPDSLPLSSNEESSPSTVSSPPSKCAKRSHADDGNQDSESEDKQENRSRTRKIKIEYIDDKSRRHVTFSKRKAGILKKAKELATLTGTQVLLLVVSETGLVYTFTTPKLQPIVTKTEGKNLIHTCLNAPDVATAIPETIPPDPCTQHQRETNTHLESPTNLLYDGCGYLLQYTQTQNYIPTPPSAYTPLLGHPRYHSQQIQTPLERAFLQFPIGSPPEYFDARYPYNHSPQLSPNSICHPR